MAHVVVTNSPLNMSGLKKMLPFECRVLMVIVLVAGHTCVLLHQQKPNSSYKYLHKFVNLALTILARSLPSV